MRYKKMGKMILFLFILSVIISSDIDVFAIKRCTEEQIKNKECECEKNISAQEVSDFFNFDSISWRKIKALDEDQAFYEFQNVDSHLKIGDPAYQSSAEKHPWVIHPSKFQNAPGKIIVVDVRLKEDVDINGVTCYAGAKIGELSIHYQAGEDNAFYSNSICTTFREKYKSRQKEAQLVVPACYVKQATNFGNVTFDTIREQQERFERQLSGKPSGRLQNLFSDEQTTEDVKNPGALQCDYYSDEKKSVTKTHVDEKTENYCYKKCKEAITVTFDPPIETQSGMCFQYVTEIKSTVECVTEFLKAPPAEPIACYDQPECRHKDATVGPQAGPNEEFDQCINQCDNGKYSQKCIDSCYKKVYVDKVFKDQKVSTNNLLSYQKKENNYVKRLAGEEVVVDGCTIGYAGGDKYIDKKVPYNDPVLVDALVKFKQQNPGGYVDKKTLQWVSAGTCPSNVAIFYFQDVSQATSTLSLLQSDEVNWHAENGFIKLGNCGADCKFNLCDDSTTSYKERVDDYNQAMDQWKADARGCGLSDEQVEACLADQTKCSGVMKECNDSVGTYEITVDDKTKYAGKETEAQNLYDAKQRQNSENVTDNFWNGESMDKGLHKGSIVKDTTGICMGNTYVGEEGSCTAETQKEQEDCKTDNQAMLQGDDSCTCYDYRDLLTFPKNYINNKSGQTTHTPSSDIGVTEVGEQYCTKLTTVNTNVDWYDWKVYGDGSLPTGEEKSAIESNTKMNINVKVQNYGYFGWNFDISCFYALIQNPLCEETGTCPCEELGTCPPDDPDPKEPHNPNPDDTTPSPDDPQPSDPDDITPVTNDLIFRTIDLNHVFIKDPRFNWNCNGTNLENSEYLVQPSSLITDIEKKGDSIYSDSNELDYKFHLDVNDLERIRKYNEENGTFLQTKGNSTQEQDGLTVYKSPFLNEFKDIIIKRGVIGCNNATGNSCSAKSKVPTKDNCYHEYMSQKGTEE